LPIGDLFPALAECADDLTVIRSMTSPATEHTHLVAPTPQAKGKIERAFQTFQNHLVTLLAHAGVNNWGKADSILQMEIQRQGGKTQRTTGKIPSEVWEEQLLKPCLIG
jgi:hypothetical protein